MNGKTRVPQFITASLIILLIFVSFWFGLLLANRFFPLSTDSIHMQKYSVCKQTGGTWVQISANQFICEPALEKVHE